MKKGVLYGPRQGWEYKKSTDRDGYVRIYGVNHPFRCGRLMIREHVAVMEIAIGRRLTRSEVVHHRNGNRSDNRIENLELMSRSEHCKHHGPITASVKQRKAGRFA